MENHQRFAEKEIKEKLDSIGARLKNEELRQISRDYASMESIAAAIARTSSIDDFAINYFKENPKKNLEHDTIANLKDSERDSIINLIFAYKTSPVAVEAVIKDVFMTLMYHPNDIETVANALNQDSVKNIVDKYQKNEFKEESLSTVMQCLGIVARHTKKSANVSKTAEPFSRCSEDKIKKYAEVVGVMVLFGQKDKKVWAEMFEQK